MAIFDQRNQKVTYQYNAAGNINFGAVVSQEDFIEQLRNLRKEIDEAVNSGAISKKTAVDVTYQIDKAILETQELKPSKKSLEQHLKGAKALLEGITAAAGLVAGMAKAVALVGALF